MTVKLRTSKNTKQFSIQSGEAWAFVSAMGYALTNIFSRIASLTIDPLVAPIFRAVPTLLIGWAHVIRFRAGWSRLQPASSSFVGWRVVLVMLLGGTMNIIGTVSFFAALKAGGVVVTAPILATSILWGALIAAIFLKEPLTRNMIGGIIIAVSGIALLGYGGSIDNQVPPEALTAIPLALVTALSWASSGNCTRYALTHGADKYLAVAFAQTWGCTLLTIVILVSGRTSLWTTDFNTIGTLLLAGLLSALALYAAAQAYSLARVVTVTTINGANPAISTILAVVLLGEEINLLMVVGITLTMIGVIYVQLTKNLSDAAAKPALSESLTDVENPGIREGK